MFTYSYNFSAQTQVNRNGPETPLKFSSENPSYLLASKTYLNCHVTVKTDESLQNDLGKKFYGKHLDDAEDDDDDDDVLADGEEVRKRYQEQYEHNMRTMNKPKSISIPPTNTKDKKRRAARSIRDYFSYEWLRDHESIITSKGDESQAINLNGFTLFKNGTLKFLASNLTTGEYRCKAKYVNNTGNFQIGPIISTSTIVETASEILLSNKIFLELKPYFFLQI